MKNKGVFIIKIIDKDGRIQKCRKIRNMKAAELADMIKRNYVTLSKYETGKASYNEKIAETIALCLGVDPKFIMYLSDDMNNIEKEKRDLEAQQKLESAIILLFESMGYNVKRKSSVSYTLQDNELNEYLITTRDIDNLMNDYTILINSKLFQLPK